MVFRLCKWRWKKQKLKEVDLGFWHFCSISLVCSLLLGYKGLQTCLLHLHMIHLPVTNTWHVIYGSRNSSYAFDYTTTIYIALIRCTTSSKNNLLCVPATNSAPSACDGYDSQRQQQKQVIESQKVPGQQQPTAVYNQSAKIRTKILYSSQKQTINSARSTVIMKSRWPLLVNYIPDNNKQHHQSTTAMSNKQ